MKELGEDSLEAHERVANYAKSESIDFLIAVGEYEKEMCQAFGEECRGYKDMEEALQQVNQWLSPKDIVLLKASRGMAFERFLPGLKDFGGHKND